MQTLANAKETTAVQKINNCTWRRLKTMFFKILFRFMIMDDRDCHVCSYFCQRHALSRLDCGWLGLLYIWDLLKGTGLDIEINLTKINTHEVTEIVALWSLSLWSDLLLVLSYKWISNNSKYFRFCQILPRCTTALFSINLSNIRCAVALPFEELQVLKILV